MGTVTFLRPYAPSATLRAMARERAREAVDCLLAKDLEGYESRKRDATALDRQAFLAEQHEAECRATARALEHVLELAERGGAAS
jgi:hypothetical protein